MEVRYLRASEIELLHHQLIDQYSANENPDVQDRGLLQSTAIRPSQTHFYRQDSDICDLAASLGFGLATNHSFHNGNKRTAAMATDVFLQLNGYKLECHPLALSDCIVKMTRHIVDEYWFADWIRRNSRELTSQERAAMEDEAEEKGS